MLLYFAYVHILCMYGLSESEYSITDFPNCGEHFYVRKLAINDGAD